MSLLGVDIGTTACKAAAFTEAGHCIALASREYPTLHPHPGWAELDAPSVWSNICEVIARVAAQTREDPITALSISSLGEAVVPVTRDRRIVGNSILCMDIRGVGQAAALGKHFGAKSFYRINPNRIGPQFSLPKILWLRENTPRAYHDADLFLLWGDFVGFMLGCDPYASSSLANRTLLYDWEADDWSDALLAWARLRRDQLGQVVAGGTPFGAVSDAVAAELGLPKGVVVVAGGHDQCCNALGCGAVSEGQMVCGIGTFECLTPVYRKPADPLQMLAQGLNIEHHVLPDLYVSFLFNQAGSLVKWFRDTFAANERPEPGEEIYARLSREIPAEPTRLLVLPHFEPPVWPHFIGDTAGAILGLRTDTTRGEILKAIMEGASFYFADALTAAQQSGLPLTECIAAGGGAQNDAWLQIQADIFGVPFARTAMSEGSLAGAAMLAGLATGVLPDVAAATERFVRRAETFVPDPGRHGIYQERLALYRQVYPANRSLLKHI